MTWRGVVTVLVVPAVLTWVIRRRYVAVRVQGQSMEPALRDGDRVLVLRTKIVEPGQIAVLAVPTGATSWLIKRVHAVPGDPVPRDTVPALADESGEIVPPGRVVLLGDNTTASYDSRWLGYFSTDDLLGVVVRTIRTTGRSESAPTSR